MDTNGCRLFAAALLLAILGSSGLGAQPSSGNPPAAGFNAQDSDAKAIELADRVMENLGGRESWDKTRYLSWNFFGLRTHLWDKWTGDLRYEPAGAIVLMNIHTKQGHAWRGGEQVTEQEELARLLDGAYKAWVNDSYWLLMPYKLKDTGVTLKYKGEGPMENGRPAHVLQLTFENVGVTPQNKYDVYVDKERLRVEQWSYYPTAADEAPRFTTPWADWQRHGTIVLSGDRGQRKLTDIAVYTELPVSVFTSPEPLDLSTFSQIH
jgi:hypothetical protein